MWPGRAVSLIDRPWSRVLRLRGRTSLARGPHGRGGKRPRDRKTGWQSECHLQVYRIYRAESGETSLN